MRTFTNPISGCPGVVNLIAEKDGVVYLEGTNTFVAETQCGSRKYIQRCGNFSGLRKLIG